MSHPQYLAVRPGDGTSGSFPGLRGPQQPVYADAFAKLATEDRVTRTLAASTGLRRWSLTSELIGAVPGKKPL